MLSEEENKFREEIISKTVWYCEPSEVKPLIWVIADHPNYRMKGSFHPSWFETWEGFFKIAWWMKNQWAWRPRRQETK